MDPALYLLFGKARAAVLSSLSDAMEEGVPLHLREIARRSEVSPTAVQYELRLLRQLDLVKDLGTASRPLYVLNRQHHLFEHLHQLFSAAPEGLLNDDAHFQHKRLRQAEDRKLNSSENSPFLRAGSPRQSGVIKKSISTGEEYEVDVLRTVNGLSAEEIRRRALEMTRDGARFLVMSPIDVLISRLENLRLIAAKQTPSGEWQTRTAVDMARAHIIDLLERQANPEAKRAATDILTAATHPMGLNAHKRYGIDVLEALPIDKFDRSKFHSFLENEWPRQVRRIHSIRELDSRRRGGHAPENAS